MGMGRATGSQMPTQQSGMGGKGGQRPMQSQQPPMGGMGGKGGQLGMAGLAKQQQMQQGGMGGKGGAQQPTYPFPQQQGGMGGKGLAGSNIPSYAQPLTNNSPLGAAAGLAGNDLQRLAQQPQGGMGGKGGQMPAYSAIDEREMNGSLGGMGGKGGQQQVPGYAQPYVQNMMQQQPVAPQRGLQQLANVKRLGR